MTKIKTIGKSLKKARSRLKKANPLRTPSTYLEAQSDAKRALGVAYKGLFLLGAAASSMFVYTESKKMLSHFIGGTPATVAALAFTCFIIYIIDITLSKTAPLAWMSILHQKRSTKRGFMYLALCGGLAFLSMQFSYNGASSPMELAFSYKKGEDVDLVALRAEANNEKEQVKKDYAAIISSAQLQDQQMLQALKQDSAKLVSECIARNSRYNYSETTANKYLQRAKEDGADKVATYSPTAPEQQQKLLNKLDDIEYNFEQYKKELEDQKAEKDADYDNAVAKGSILTRSLGIGSTLLGFIVVGLYIVSQMPENQPQAKRKAKGKQNASNGGDDASNGGGDASIVRARVKKALRDFKNKAYSSLRRIRDNEGDIKTNVQNVLEVYEEISLNLGQDALLGFLNQLASSGTYPIFTPEDLINLLKQS